MSLAWTSHGSGPTLVFLHGLFGSGDNLRGLGRSFEARCRVVYPDLPNHGDSPHTEHAGFDEMTGAVARLLTGHDLGPAVLAGHSMGGKVAMRLALDRPELVRGLVVLDMAPRPYDPSHREIIDAMLRLPVEEVESRADADRRLAESIPSRAVRSFLLKNLVKENGGYRWRLNLPLLQREYERILSWEGSGSYGGPTLFLGGTGSKYLKPERDQELIHGYFPDARIRMLEGAGHWIHSERPDEVRDAIERFLGELDGVRT